MPVCTGVADVFISYSLLLKKLCDFIDCAKMARHTDIKAYKNVIWHALCYIINGKQKQVHK